MAYKQKIKKSVIRNAIAFSITVTIIAILSLYLGISSLGINALLTMVAIATLNSAIRRYKYYKRLGIFYFGNGLGEW